MTPVAVPPLPRRRNHLHELSAVVRRHLRQVRHSPEQLVELAVQPILFVLLFGVVLAGQMGGPEGNYLTFVVPGLMTQAAVLIAARTAIGLHADMDNGLLERMRALPISRLTPLAGRVIADILMLLWSLVVLIAASIAIGYRAHVTILGAVATIAVIVVFCFSLCWIAILAGLRVRSAESIQALAFGAMLPLTILSGAFVNTATVPAWLQPVMEWNPVSIAAETIRGLIAGADVTIQLEHLVLVCAAMLALFMPLAVRAFKRER